MKKRIRSTIIITSLMIGLTLISCRAIDENVQLPTTTDSPTNNIPSGELSNSGINFTETLEPTATQTTVPAPQITEISPTGGVTFVDSGQILGNEASWRVVLGDLDGDHDLDAVVANDRRSKIWFNNGSGIFSDSEQHLGTMSSIDIIDLDLDGDLDVFSVGTSVSLWKNDGRGNFIEEEVKKQNCSGVALGDIDADGDMDALVTRMGMPNQVWINNGKGVFEESPQILGGSEIMYDDSLDILLADLDGDDDLDAFEINYNGYHRVWLNDGTGLFTLSDQIMKVGNHSHGIALADLDSDGDLDAFITLTGDLAFRVWYNDGKGIFSPGSQQITISNPAQSVALGDLDGDGDLDAFLAHSGYSEAGYGNTIWLGDGYGNFYDSGLRLRHAYSLDIALGDLDGDGDLDAFIANSNFNDPSIDKSNRVWINETNHD